MAIDSAAVLTRIRDRLSELPALKRSYAASEKGPKGLPDGLKEFPCATVVPGVTLVYMVTQPRHRHTYEVLVDVFADGALLDQRAAAVMPAVEAIIAALTENLTLGGLVTYCKFARHSGLVKLTYSGNEHMGYEVVLEVSEEATIDATGGIDA